MPVLAQVRERLAGTRPLEGVRVAICLHVTAETANLVRALNAGGAQVSLCAANPLSTQQDVAETLIDSGEAEVHASHAESPEEFAEHVRTLVEQNPQVTIDVCMRSCGSPSSGSPARLQLSRSWRSPRPSQQAGTSARVWWPSMTGSSSSRYLGRCGRPYPRGFSRAIRRLA